MRRHSNLCVIHLTFAAGIVFIRYHKRTGGNFHDGKAGLSVTVPTHRHLVSRQRLLEDLDLSLLSLYRAWKL